MIGDDKAAAEKVAQAWAKWEIRCRQPLEPNEDFVAALTGDDNCWALSRHEADYMVHDCFLSENRILANCDKIQDIPPLLYTVATISFVRFLGLSHICY